MDLTLLLLVLLSKDEIRPPLEGRRDEEEGCPSPKVFMLKVHVCRFLGRDDEGRMGRVSVSFYICG